MFNSKEGTPIPQPQVDRPAAKDRNLMAELGELFPANESTGTHDVVIQIVNFGRSSTSHETHTLCIVAEAYEGAAPVKHIVNTIKNYVENMVPFEFDFQEVRELEGGVSGQEIELNFRIKRGAVFHGLN